MDLNRSRLSFHPRSLVSHAGVEYGLVRESSGVKLALLSPSQAPEIEGFEGEHSELGRKILLVGPPSPKNAAGLRSNLPWLQPQLLGFRTSAGMGDRIGLATPGHVRAVRAVSGISPIFAQQSIREITRTGRTPQQVIDDATWGIFQEGWREGVGADADHLKTIQDIDQCLAAGFTFFTIDPGLFVDQRAETASIDQLRRLADTLPADLRPDASGLSGQRFNIEGLTIYFDEATLLKTAVKYGRAIAHVAMMYQHISKVAGKRPFELEVSVDETDYPTSHAEHIYITSELKRNGVHWVSLAPRFIGRFEKGVEYIGDFSKFETDFAGHAAIARHFGGYKLSLHSGSDKFSLYPIVARLAQGRVHLKTAGTSYLEALRTIAEVDANLFREIFRYSCQRYVIDKASYHVSAEIDQVGMGLELEKDGLPRNDDLPLLLNDFHARQILHVTYGSVLTEKTDDGRWRFYDRVKSQLRGSAETYAENLEKHFIRHLQPFAK